MSIKGSGSFSKLVNDFAKEVPELAVQATNKSVLDLFSKVVMDTPVKDGRLRGNWQVSIGQTVNGEVPQSQWDKDGEKTIRRAKDKLLTDKTTMPLFIQNNVPYAKKIEYGGSRIKAPQGMLRKNLSLMNQFLRNAIAELRGGK